MLEKLKEYKNIEYFEQFRDVRNAGLIVFVVIVLLISWSGVKAIQTNFELQKQISGLQQANTVQELENTNLKLQNEYYNTDQYIELTARQNFGLGAPGETELIVPKSVAMKYTTKFPDSNSQKAPQTIQPFYQKNFQAWMDFFMHRQTSND